MPAIVPIKVIKAPACRIPLPFFTVEIKVPFNTRKLPSAESRKSEQEAFQPYKHNSKKTVF